MFDDQSFDSNSSGISIKGATQIQLEQLYSKHQLLGAIRNYFKDIGVVPQFEALGIPTHFGLDLLAQMVLHKRANIPTLVGLLMGHFKMEENPTQACADAIHKACAEDVVDWDPISSKIVVRHFISDDLQDRLDVFQYPLPMIEEPLPIENNRQSGYYTIQSSVILKKNHHEDDVCLDHLNRMNAQKLRINADTVAFIQNQWKNIDQAKPGETSEDFQKRRAAFEKYDRVSRDVIDALLMQEDPKKATGFWLTHRYDKRGRTYCQGYHVNYQGNDWCKAVVEFAEAETLNDA